MLFTFWRKQALWVICSLSSEPVVFVLVPLGQPGRCHRVSPKVVAIQLRSRSELQGVSESPKARQGRFSPCVGVIRFLFVPLGSSKRCPAWARVGRVFGGSVLFHCWRLSVSEADVFVG